MALQAVFAPPGYALGPATPIAHRRSDLTPITRQRLYVTPDHNKLVYSQCRPEKTAPGVCYLRCNELKQQPGSSDIGWSAEHSTVPN
uniref:Uncharacterized protein n=1 Tax=Pseudoalteromonas rubra TaxID=43658 RepID=A0A0F4QHC8_9GAMM|nr:hypothetical protein TW77_18185 [Pseudoalteromonas rubra]